MEWHTSFCRARNNTSEQPRGHADGETIWTSEVLHQSNCMKRAGEIDLRRRILSGSMDIDMAFRGCELWNAP